MAFPDYDQILTEVDDSILVVTLNRPDRLNAWTYRLMAEMADAVRRANDDDGIEGIVVTGAGRGFCAGADVGDVFQAGGGDEPDNRASDDWVELVRASKPIGAAVNGPAIGVGLSMILPFDVIVADRDAKLSLRFIKMGLVPELASSRFMTLRCGWGAASDLALTGRTVLGDEALRLGLVDGVTDPGGVLAETVTRVRAMGENPLAAIRAVKELFTVNATETDLAAVQKRELAALAEAFRSPEHQEAIAAFMEKRPPDFKAARERDL
ncbi:MAG: enoyl-CoA hydratase-related protein [Actinomycetota bacterium]